MKKAWFFLFYFWSIECFSGASAYITEQSGGVSVIDTNSGSVTPITSNYFAAPTGVAISSDGSLVYVSDVGNGSVSIISSATKSVVGNVPVGSYPQGIAASHSGSYFYTANAFGDSVSVGNASSPSVSTILLPGGSSPRGIAVSQDDAYLFVACANGYVYKIRTSDGALVANANIGGAPQGVILSHSGAWVYLANYGDGTVTKVNSSLDQISVTTIQTSIYSPGNYFARAVVISPDDGTLYVTQYKNDGTNSGVSVINAGTPFSYTGSIALPDYSSPYGISISLDGSKLYVANQGTASVSEINISGPSVSFFTVGANPTAFGNFIVSTPSPVPTVTSVSPSSGTVAGGTALTISGTGFSGASGITVGGAACTVFNVVSDTSATCTTPAGSIGLASIVVTTGGGSNAANTLFTYTAVPAAVPTLSEWSQMLLGLMVLSMIGWHFHRERLS